MTPRSNHRPGVRGRRAGRVWGRWFWSTESGENDAANRCRCRRKVKGWRSRGGSGRSARRICSWCSLASRPSEGSLGCFSFPVRPATRGLGRWPCSGSCSGGGGMLQGVPGSQSGGGRGDEPDPDPVAARSAARAATAYFAQVSTYRPRRRGEYTWRLHAASACDRAWYRCSCPAHLCAALGVPQEVAGWSAGTATTTAVRCAVTRWQSWRRRPLPCGTRGSSGEKDEARHSGTSAAGHWPRFAPAPRVSRSRRSGTLADRGDLDSPPVRATESSMSGPRAIRRALILVALCLGAVSCGALGHKPTVVDEASVPIPSDLTVVLRSTTPCRPAEESGWDWRDLLLQTSLTPDAAIAELRDALQAKGFRFDAAQMPSAPGLWYSLSGSNGSVGVQVGTGTDYKRFDVIGDTNAVVADAVNSASYVVMRLKPEKKECMV